MANASVGERVYLEVKRRLLAGEFAPGERLDIGALSQTLSASITPVRSALSRLVGEDLLEAHARDGFHRPFVSEQVLRDLYDWNAVELTQALVIASSNRVLVTLDPVEDGIDNEWTGRTERLFQAIAASSRNIACERIVWRLNDQLHAIRRVEKVVVTGIEEELVALEAHYEAGRYSKVSQGVELYHLRRRRAVAEIMAEVHRPAGGRVNHLDD